MEIAIIGTGNVGSALAKKWAKAGHEINLGVRDKNNFKGFDLLSYNNISCYLIEEAVLRSQVIVVATPANSAIEVAKSLGDTTGKIIIDTMNIVFGNGPEGYSNTTDAIIDNTNSIDVVKCFNSTGANNMEDANYGDQKADMFMAGDSEKGKEIAKLLSYDAGFAQCYDIGGNDKFFLLEQIAFFWINLAIKGKDREFIFKILKR